MQPTRPLTSTRKQRQNRNCRKVQPLQSTQYTDLTAQTACQGAHHTIRFTAAARVHEHNKQSVGGIFGQWLPLKHTPHAWGLAGPATRCSCCILRYARLDPAEGDVIVGVVVGALSHLTPALAAWAKTRTALNSSPRWRHRPMYTPTRHYHHHLPPQGTNRAAIRPPR